MVTIHLVKQKQDKDTGNRIYRKTKIQVNLNAVPARAHTHTHTYERERWGRTFTHTPTTVIIHNIRV